ncbi:hypothetical protein WA026_020209 [Henosepilachna vigintioctopunctata]|uniref:Selenoprotein K n=1 Tax=Henosepilachna vigintioctopunctata TaxID=420089 RepID=A0AAW1UAR1_9CUCU
MVYISGDGTVCDKAPWSIDRVLKMFYGLINFVILFFQTLVGLDVKPKQSLRSGGGGPKKFMTLRDVNPPTIGGCPGGACGR